MNLKQFTEDVRRKLNSIERRLNRLSVAGGEANTASNIGVGGVGLYQQKVAVDLQFRNINAGSNKITVALDAPNNEVDIDVDFSKVMLNDIGDCNVPAPNDGDVLTWDNGAAEWVPTAPVAAGEVNTASNIGAGGIGLYQQKVGVDLQFRNINAASARISVVLDAGNNEVDIDVVEAQILHNSLGGLQGGQANQYYHLDALEHGYVSGVNAQSVLITASPTFVTAKLSALSDGYIPYHVSDVAGLANSPIITDGSVIGIGAIHSFVGFYHIATINAVGGCARTWQQDSNLVATANNDTLEGIRVTSVYTRGVYAGVESRGIYIASGGGTLDYGIYITGETLNYFSGNILIGTMKAGANQGAAGAAADELWRDTADNSVKLGV